MGEPTEIVWIAGDSPDHVFLRAESEGDPTHYFYFPTQIFPWPKRSDIEPVRRGNGSSVLSRLHYHGLIAWVGPSTRTIRNETRPVCRFLSSAHTPVIESLEYKAEQLTVESTKIGKVDKAVYLLGYQWLKANLKNEKKFKFGTAEYRRKIAVLVPGSDYLKKEQQLDLDYLRLHMKFLVLIGRSNEREAVENAIRRNGNGRLTSDAIIQTLIA